MHEVILLTWVASKSFKKTLTLFWAIFRTSLLRNSSPHYVLNKILYNGKVFIGYRCFGALWSAHNWPWPWPCCCSWLWNGFLEPALRIKPNNAIAVVFLLVFLLIQLCDSRKIHHLTREFLVKLHLKTEITLIASRFVQYRFSSANLTRNSRVR